MSLVSIRAALETALANMPGIIPAVDIVSSNADIFTTAIPHRMVTGLSVTITGNSVPALNGTFGIVVTGPTTFTLVSSSTGMQITKQAAGVGGVLRANLTAWEGVAFKPVPGVPHQRVHLLPAMPENPSYGGFIREIGMMQVALYYPTQRGPREATLRAEMIRSLFSRGKVFTADGIDVKILRTPVIMPGREIDESYTLPVLVQYQADIFE